MDDLESLFRVRGARGAAPAAGEAPTHVLFGADDQDLLLSLIHISEPTRPY